VDERQESSEGASSWFVEKMTSWRGRREARGLTKRADEVKEGEEKKE
jgi:hypothetical protein